MEFESLPASLSNRKKPPTKLLTNQGKLLNPQRLRQHSSGRLHSFLHPDAASEEDQTVIQIQKKLNALSSIQNSFQRNLNLSLKAQHSFSPPKHLSARRPRKGVIYYPADIMKRNIIEITAQSHCTTCNTDWVTDTVKNSCELCGKQFEGVAVEMDLRVNEDKTVVLRLGGKEVKMKMDERLRCVLALKAKEEKTNELEVTEVTDFTRVETPSFQAGSERIMDSNLGEIPQSSFMFTGQKTLVEIYNEIDILIEKQFKVLQSPTIGTIKELCDSISSGYSSVFKKISYNLPDGLSRIIDKCSRNLLCFMESCLISLLRYISQLQSQLMESKEPDKCHINRISTSKSAQRHTQAYKNH